MEAFKISKGSWHYKMVNVWSSHNVPEDICSYTKYLLGALLISLLALCALGGILGFYLYSGYLFLEWLFFQNGGKFPDGGAIFPLMSGIAFVTFFIIIGFNRFNEFLHTEIRPPSFIRAAYRSFRDKFCMKLDFVDKQ